MLGGVWPWLADRCPSQKVLFVRQVAARFTVLSLTSGFAQADSEERVCAKSQGVWMSQCSACVCAVIACTAYGHMNLHVHVYFYMQALSRHFECVYAACSLLHTILSHGRSNSSTLLKGKMPVPRQGIEPATSECPRIPVAITAHGRPVCVCVCSCMRACE